MGKFSLYKQYLFFSLIIPLLITTFLVCTTLINYAILKKDKIFLYKNEASKIENLIESSFNYISKFSTLAGKKIIYEDPISAFKIGEILQKTYSIAKIGGDVLSLTLFDFVTPDGKVIANVLQGEFKNPLSVDKNDREWMTLAPKEPWKLHISQQPVKGIVPEGQIIDYGIPVGLGITDNSGNFRGIISGGVDINKLTDTINSSVISSNIKFLILNNAKEPITDSNKGYITQYSEDLIKNLKTKLPNSIQSNGKIKEPLIYNDNKYFFIKKLTNYPYIILIGESNYVIQKELREKILPSIIQIFVTLIFLSALLYFFCSKLVNPLLSLSNATNKISQGNAVNIPEYNIPEIEILANEIRKISLYTKELEEKVSQRTEKLEQALKTKTEFLNNMSHEVRTPIQGIVNISQGLIDHWEGYKDKDRLFFASKVAENGKRLISLVSNLLDLSKFGAGKMKYTISKADLIVLIKEMMSEGRDLYVGSKRIEIEFETDLSSAPIICDADKITQLLRNLYANAIKFTKEGKIIGRLSKTIINAEDGYKFSISDSGVGIPVGEEESIFEPFTQSTRTKTRAGGTGLGLSICKNVIDAHRGKIWARNNRPLGKLGSEEEFKEDLARRTGVYSNIGEDLSTKPVHKLPSELEFAGATIEFTIPATYHNDNIDEYSYEQEEDEEFEVTQDIMSAKVTSEETQEPQEPKQEEKVTPKLASEEEFKGNLAHRNGIYSNVVEDSSTKPVNKLPSEVEFTKEKTILLIDDEEAAYLSMEVIIASIGHKLLYASGGIEGLKMLRKYKDEIDLVLLDLMMPDMYGLSVLKAIREDGSLKDIKVILQTGSNDEGELEKARALGIISIIHKPYNKSGILKIIAHSL